MGLAAFGVGVLHTGIAYVLMNSAFPRLTTPVIGVITFIYPVVAIIVDWGDLYGHPLGPAQAAGMALIALATLGVRLGWRSPRMACLDRVSPEQFPEKARRATPWELLQKPRGSSQPLMKPMKSSGAARPISSSQWRRQSET